MQGLRHTELRWALPGLLLPRTWHPQKVCAATAAASTVATTTNHTLTPTSRVVHPRGCKRLLHRDGNMLDGRDKGTRVLGRGRYDGQCSQLCSHCCHLGHNGCLIGRQLINGSGDRVTIGSASRWCCASCGACIRLRDCCDHVVIGIIIIPVFQDIVHCLVGVSVLAGCAAKGQCSEADKLHG